MHVYAKAILEILQDLAPLGGWILREVVLNALESIVGYLGWPALGMPITF
jgi:hypothetical protein